MEQLLSDLIANNDLSSYGESKVDPWNQYKRLPIIGVIDTSNIMASKETLLKESVEKLYDSILNDERMAGSVELSIISCNSSEIKIFEKLREIRCHEDKGKNISLQFEGIPSLGLGLKAAIGQIELRKKVYKSNRPIIKYYAPIIFVLGAKETITNALDLHNHEEQAFKYCKAYIQQEVLSNRLSVFAFPTDEFQDIALLQEITGLSNDSHIINLKSANSIALCLKILSSFIFGWHKVGNPTINNGFGKRIITEE